MAKGKRGGRRAEREGSMTQSHTGATVTQQASGTGDVTSSNRDYTQMSDTDATRLRTKYDESYKPDVVDAIKLYISNSNPNKDGFSHSQNLNYKLDHGAKLNPTEKFIDDNIQKGMHDLGRDTKLTRYCHDDILQQCGISNYQNMSESQLKSALIGTEFQTTSYTSYSYDTNKNPFRPSAIGGNGREVTMVTNAGADTKMVYGKKTQAEIVVNKGTKQKITDVYYDGTTAYPRNKNSMPRVVIVTETI